MPASVKSAKKPATARRAVAAPKAAPSRAAKQPATATTEAPARKTKRNGAAVADQQRRNYIEVAAYYIAERRGFQGGSELEDWAQAEYEVDCLLREKKLSS